MTTFLLAHPWMAFVSWTEVVLAVVVVSKAYARALQAWGTKHCGTCACHIEAEGHIDDDDERQESPQ